MEGSGQEQAGGGIGNSVPVRPAGLAVAKDRPGQLPKPIPGLVSPDHDPDPSLDLCTFLPHTCQCLPSPHGHRGGREEEESWEPSGGGAVCVWGEVGG